MLLASGRPPRARASERGVARRSVESAPELVTATNNFLVAASESDFGGTASASPPWRRLPPPPPQRPSCLRPVGYFFPVAGLTLLGAIITFLSPPLKDE